MNNAILISNEVRETAAAPSKRARPIEWKRAILICMLLGISGGVRYWRDWQFHSLLKESEAPPFALGEIPKALGAWHAVEGSDDTLEPEIARIAGASDHIIRTYVDERSGQSASVMVLYGLANVVWAHTPDACYPATGFRAVSPSRDKDLEIRIPEKATPAQFRLQHFVKSKAGQTDYREVCYSFRNAGQWAPDMGKNWKSFRYHPGMFKVQVQCQASSSAKIDESAIKELLERIVQEIERGLASEGQANPAVAKGASP